MSSNDDQGRRKGGKLSLCVLGQFLHLACDLFAFAAYAVPMKVNPVLNYTLIIRSQVGTVPPPVRGLALYSGNASNQPTARLQRRRNLANRLVRRIDWTAKSNDNTGAGSREQHLSRIKWSTRLAAAIASTSALYHHERCFTSFFYTKRKLRRRASTRITVDEQ